MVFKLLHILAATAFLGNIFTGLFWMQQAHKSGNLLLINHTVKTVILSDRLFTIPGVVIILAGGVGAAMQLQLSLLNTGWIFWAIVLFSLSGIVFGWKLVPLQKKIFRMTQGKPSVSSFDWNEYKKLFNTWEVWGLVALITPFLALVLMVLKWPAQAF
jgi:uncharacterized membrane protein